MALELNLQNTELTGDEIAKLAEIRKNCARRILLATSLASSGHPGGSLSTLDMLLVTYGCIKHNPADSQWQGRDRVVMSIGHVSPGVYSVLAENGYFTEEDFLTGFRRAGSGFPGHVERVAPGVEWDTGNLGQGLSTAVGMAQAFKMKGLDQKVICYMGDGEQQKGQIAEAMRYANKYNLNNLIVIVDRNHIQICGTTEEIMDIDVAGLFEVSGWNVMKLDDGHDTNKFFQTFRKAYLGEVEKADKPTMIEARTVMAKGISFMEDLAKYHGSPLNQEQLAEAFKELEVENDFDKWAELRKAPVATNTKLKNVVRYPDIMAGEAITYDSNTDCRSAYGNALHSLAQANNVGGVMKIAGISCDLEGSVKMGDFHKHSPTAYFETGIQEHHAASMGAAISREEVACFFSTFGVFAVSEVYNQNRISDINETNFKVVATHCGLDVGEDGPTHQGIDYIGLMRNYFRFNVYIPADPNQTDRVIRTAAVNPGNVFVGMGRSKMGMVLAEDGSPFFGGDYQFTPGKGDWVRTGNSGTIITYGAVTPNVMEAWQKLKDEGVDVGVLVMASVAPVDKDAIIEAVKKGPVLTVEDHHVDTGLGSIVATVIADNGLAATFKRLGVTRYGASGKPADLYAAQGLDGAGIVKSFKEML
ncbi:MAG: transketolase [Thermodesulfobacteriota bacterium]